jgi:putative hydrolase of the HAD superfamily
VARDELTGLWHQLFELHFPRYLAGELSMQEQRRARMRGVMGHRAAPPSDEALDEAFAVYLDAYEHNCTCFPDVLPALSLLSRHRLGVITNGDRGQQTRKLEHAGLAHFFSVVLTSEECGAAKPDSRIFHEACRRAGGSVGGSVHIGDNWSADVGGSRAAGLRPIWLRRDQARREDVGDVPVIETLHDLPPVLSSLRQ